jgi:large-conductance mechanosensitive channel
MLFKFINNIINYSVSIFDSFVKFMVDNNLVSLFMAAIIGLALSNLINSLRINILDYYLNKLFKTTDNNLINFGTSVLQFLLIVIMLYFLHNHFLKKINEKYVSHEPHFNDTLWKENILLQLKNINSKMT